jgi:hypothetical protein
VIGHHRIRPPAVRQPGTRAAGADRRANHWGVNWDGNVDEDIPLRRDLRTRGLLDRSVPWLR